MGRHKGSAPVECLVSRSSVSSAYLALGDHLTSGHWVLVEAIIHPRFTQYKAVGPQMNLVFFSSNILSHLHIHGYWRTVSWISLLGFSSSMGTNIL